MVVGKIYVNGVQAKVNVCQRIPVGAVGLKLEIEYDDIWNNLSKTVVFKGCVTKDIVGVGGEVTIPTEVIAEIGSNLYVGIYGTRADGSLAVPTLWADLGRVYSAADPSGDETTEASLPVWAQIQADLSAFIESGTGKPGENGATFIPSVDEQGNLSWSNDKGLENPATVNIRGPGGEAAADGLLLCDSRSGDDRRSFPAGYVRLLR